MYRGMGNSLQLKSLRMFGCTATNARSYNSSRWLHIERNPYYDKDLRVLRDCPRCTRGRRPAPTLSAVEPLLPASSLSPAVLRSSLLANKLNFLCAVWHSTQSCFATVH